MDYIINPMWVYWINVLGDVKIVCCILAVFSGIALSISIAAAIDNKNNYGEDDADYKTARLCTRIFLPIFIVTFIVALFAPSTKVMIEMLIARYATKQNVEIGIDAIKSATDYVIEAIKSLK